MQGISLTPSFQQIPYNIVLERVDSGSQGLFELTSFLVERKELEEKAILFSSKVSRSNLYAHEIPNSTGEKVLGFFKNYFLYLSKVQVKYHKDMGENIVKELEELKVLRAAGINKHKSNVQNSLREVTNAEEALDKAKKNYSKAKSDFERGQGKLAVAEEALAEAHRLQEEQRRERAAMGKTKDSKWKMFSSAFEADPEQERDKQFKKVERRHHELVMCMGQIIEKKNALIDRISSMDAALHRANIAFQEAETERTLRLKSVIKQFCSIERAAITARSELLNTLEEAVHSHDPGADMDLFITQSRQVELTHKYTNALELMDTLYQQIESEKQAAPTQEDHVPSATLQPRSGGRRRNSSNVSAGEVAASISAGAALASPREPADGSVLPSVNPSQTAAAEEEFAPRDNITVTINREGTVIVHGGDGLQQSQEWERLSTMCKPPHSTGLGDASSASWTGIETVEANPWDTAAAKLATGSGANLTGIEGVDSTKTINVDDDNESVSDAVNLSFKGMTVASPEDLKTLSKMSAELSAVFRNTADGSMSGRPRVCEGSIDAAAVDSSMNSVMSGRQVSIQRHMPSALLGAVGEVRRVGDEGETSPSRRGGSLYFTAEQEELVEKWANLLVLHEARELFLQELDDRRGAHARLVPAAYESMACAMKAFLDHCDAFDDVKSAMRITNMANTFHRLEEVQVEAEEKRTVGESAAEGSSTGSVPVASDMSKSPSVTKAIKIYLQSEPSITKHNIWRKPGFWEASLQEGVLTQMKLTNMSEDAPLWDELSPDSLREAVIGIHNLVFAQLVALAFTMHDVGLSMKQVMSNVVNMCRRAQLTEDQEQDLVRNVRALFGKPPEVTAEEADEAAREAMDKIAARMGKASEDAKAATVEAAAAVAVATTISSSAKGAVETRNQTIPGSAHDNGDGDDDDDDDFTAPDSKRRESLFNSDFDYVDDEADRLLDGMSTATARRSASVTSGYSKSAPADTPVGTVVPGYTGDTAPTPVGAVGLSRGTDGVGVFAGNNTNTGAKFTLVLPEANRDTPAVSEGSGKSSGSFGSAVGSGSSSGGNGTSALPTATVIKPNNTIVSSGLGSPAPAASGSGGENSFLKFFGRSSSASTPAKASGSRSMSKTPQLRDHDDLHTL